MSIDYSCKHLDSIYDLAVSIVRNADCPKERYLDDLHKLVEKVRKINRQLREDADAVYIKLDEANDEIEQLKRKLNEH